MDSITNGSEKGQQKPAQSAEDQFAEARWRYMRGMIDEAEFYAAHRAMREEKANGK